MSTSGVSAQLRLYLIC